LATFLAEVKKNLQELKITIVERECEVLDDENLFSQSGYELI